MGSPLRGLAAVAFCFALTLACRAQDVLVGPVSLLPDSEPVDELPVFVGRFTVEFPDELKKTPDIGWVDIQQFVDATGEVRGVAIHASDPIFEHEAKTADVSAKRYKAARRGEKPVDAVIRFAVIFNPRTASIKTPDATPRLLNAAPVVEPSVGTIGGPPESGVVWATVHVNEAGQATLTNRDGVPSPTATEAALSKWRFSPARVGGKPTGADVRVPILYVRPDRYTKGFHPPRPIHQTKPTYPFALRRSGLRGEVEAEYTIDSTGHVRDAVIVRSLNSAFNEPALDAIQRWTYEPAKLKGVPVNLRVRQIIAFSLEGTPDGGGNGQEVVTRGDPAKLPEGLRYDVAPEPRSIADPIYPYSLLRDKRTGKAELLLVVDRFGHVTGTRVLSASQPEFGLALQAAVEVSEYRAATRAGKPTESAIRYQTEFAYEVGRILSQADFDALALEKRHPEQIISAKELDHGLKPRYIRPPRYPSGLEGDKNEHAVVEILVMSDGRPALPRIVSASAPEFGYAAVQAVAAWRFAAPTKAGKPVVTRVQVPFEFSLKDSKSAASPPADGKPAAAK